MKYILMLSRLHTFWLIVIPFLPRHSANPICRGCQLYHDNAPKLYIHERMDGPGATMHNFLYALGVAARNGMNFGGILQRAQPHINKGVNVTKMMIKTFQITEPDQLFINPTSNLNFDRNFTTLQKLERTIDKHGRFNYGERIYLQAHTLVKESGLEGVHAVRPNMSLDEYLSPVLLRELRGCQLPWLEDQRCFEQKHNAPLSVVMHARRGGDHAGTDDSEFFRVSKLVQRLLPGVEILVHSLLQGFNETAFRSHGFRVQTGDIHSIEVEELFAAWTSFARADVLFIDTSSFSWLPAFFNPNCVIYHPYRIQYGKDRLALSSWEPSTDEERITRCVMKQLRMRHTDRIR